MGDKRLATRLAGTLLACGFATISAFGANTVGDSRTALDTTGNNATGDTTVNMGSNPQDSALRTPIAGNPVATKILQSKSIAYKMARYEWLDKAAAENPCIIAAICTHPGPAKVLAAHRHLDKIADADHYLCRRLTQYPAAADVLAHNPVAAHVLALDPQGIYYAICQNPNIGRVLSSHTMFAEMMRNDPNLGRVIAEHMR